MNDPINDSNHTGIDRFALRLADVVIHHPWKAILAMVLITVVGASGMRDLAFANNYRVFFGADNPELQAFETFQNTYTKNDNLLLVVPAGPEGLGRIDHDFDLAGTQRDRHRRWSNQQTG